MAPKREAKPGGGLRWANERELRRHLGKRLTEIRSRRSFTQDELCDASGVGTRQIQKLERAQGGGSLETWDRLANALDVPLEELFRPTDQEPAAAREPRVPYKFRGRAKQRATEDQLDALMSAARRPDAKTVDGLIFFARGRK